MNCSLFFSKFVPFDVNGRHPAQDTNVGLNGSLLADKCSDDKLYLNLVSILLNKAKSHEAMNFDNTTAVSVL